MCGGPANRLWGRIDRIDQATCVLTPSLASREPSAGTLPEIGADRWIRCLSKAKADRRRRPKSGELQSLAGQAPWPFHTCVLVDATPGPIRFCELLEGLGEAGGLDVCRVHHLRTQVDAADREASGLVSGAP